MPYTAAQKRRAFHIYDVGRKRGESRKELLSALMTALVESGLGNPTMAESDADSAGWRQERSHYGSEGKRRNVRGAARRYYSETSALGDGKGMRAGDLAANVQRPAEQFRGRYEEVRSQATDLLNWLEQTHGKGGKTGGRYEPGRMTGKTVTTPGIDRSADREALKMQTLTTALGQNRMPSQSELLGLASGLRELKDTPSESKLELGYKKGGYTGGGGGRGGGGRGKGGQVHEVFYDPLNRYYDSGQVQPGAIGGHEHVHVAASPKLVIRIGREAQRRGLDVREHPAFDPVDPVHTEGSFHYKRRAIDVSGDPAVERQFAADMIRRAKRKQRRRA